MLQSSTSNEEEKDVDPGRVRNENPGYRKKPREPSVVDQLVTGSKVDIRRFPRPLDDS
jgi:hypothetical protein